MRMWLCRPTTSACRSSRQWKYMRALPCLLTVNSSGRHRDHHSVLRVQSTLPADTDTSTNTSPNRSQWRIQRGVTASVSFSKSDVACSVKNLYSLLCAFAIKDDAVDTLSSALLLFKISRSATDVTVTERSTDRPTYYLYR